MGAPMSSHEADRVARLSDTKRRLRRTPELIRASRALLASLPPEPSSALFTRRAVSDGAANGSAQLLVHTVGGDEAEASLLSAGLRVFAAAAGGTKRCPIIKVEVIEDVIGLSSTDVSRPRCTRTTAGVVLDDIASFIRESASGAVVTFPTVPIKVFKDDG